MSRVFNTDARFDAEKGKWVTTHEKKRKIHINENGVPDKGNPFVIAKMTGAKPKVSTGYRKKNLHALLSSGRTAKAVKALKDLDEGATIELTNGTVYTKVGSGFVSSKGKTGGKQTPQALVRILSGHAKAGKDFTVGDPKPESATADTPSKGSKTPEKSSAPVYPKIYSTGQLGSSHGFYMGDDPMKIPKGPPKTYQTDSGHEFVDAGDILSSCKSTDTTKDIIERQGFSGLPRRVSKEEFQKIAKQSGFVSKRTYSAASQEIADEYRRQLYEGDFFVDCSVGGAQYGQGMYCAADFTGKGYNPGIDEEMKHYQKLNIARQADNAFILSSSTSDLNKAIDECKAAGAYSWGGSGYKHMTPAEHEVFKKYVTRQKLSPKEERIMAEHGGFADVQKVLATDVAWSSMGTVSSSREKSATKRKFLESYKGYKKTEVVTLDPSAKIISFNALKAKYKAYKGTKPKDLGAFAAAMGYDAINAYGHGKSGSYTVILNRTKCVFMDRPINGDSVDEPKESRIKFIPGKHGRFHAYRDGQYLGWVDTYVGNQT